MPAKPSNSSLKAVVARRILVVRFSAIGDVAMTLPALYTACRLNPDVEFVMVTRPSTAAIAVNPPANLKVHGADVDSRYKGPAGMWRLLRELEREYGRFDAMADLHGVIRSRLLGLPLRLRGTRVEEISKDRQGASRLTRRTAKEMRPLESRIDAYADVFRRLGLDSRPEDFEGVDAAELLTALPARLSTPKKAGEIRIGIAPFARHRGKIYPPEKMAKVVEQLASLSGVRIYLFGGAGREQEILQGWTAGNVESLAGERLGFAAEMALMGTLDAMVSMDSANMHLAALTGVPVVSVWGATHPACGFRAWRQEAANEVALELPCRPCSVFGDRKCAEGGDYHCLEAITPEAIVDKVKKILESNRGN